MDAEGMKAMLDRGHRDVRIKTGRFATMAAKVTGKFNPAAWWVEVPGVGGFVAYPEDLEPAYPATGPDLLRESDDPRRREPREAPATIYTTTLGALAWQQSRPSDRRIHFGVVGHVLTAWATTLSSGYATREIKFAEPLPASAVPPIIDRALSAPADPHHAVGHGHDGLDDLFANVG